MAAVSLDFLDLANPYGLRPETHADAELSEESAFYVPSLYQPTPEASSKHEYPGNSEIKFAHGTTTLAFKFKDGIIVTTDSRASMGPFVGSGTVKKILPISQYIVGTMAGGAADCAFWMRNLSRHVNLFELRNRESLSVAATSKLLCNFIYSYKGMGLSMGTMIAGVDKKTGVYSLYYIDDEGTRLKGDIFSAGSGSTYAFGVLDQRLKDMPNMGLEEAIELGRRAVFHATHRDAYSGGFINVCVIGPDGWRLVDHRDMNELWDMYMPHEAEQPRQLGGSKQPLPHEPFNLSN